MIHLVTNSFHIVQISHLSFLCICGVVSPLFWAGAIHTELTDSQVRMHPLGCSVVKEANGWLMMRPADGNGGRQVDIPMILVDAWVSD